MVISIHKRSNGFTVIELLVVMLVIIGLGFIAFNGRSDVLGRDRDTERRSDINLLYQQLEFYYDLGETNTYPTLANLQDDAWVAENMKALAEEALVDPAGRKVGTEGSNYTYEPENCDANGCASFKLTANQEKSAPDPYVKNSVNQ